MSHPVDEGTVIGDQSHDLDDHTVRPRGSDPSGSSGEFEPSPNLRARIEKLAGQRIDTAWITFAQNAPEFRGGHGVVSEARMVKPGSASKSKVAIKSPIIADDENFEKAVGLYIREAEFLAKLTHQNIVPFKGFVEDLSKKIIWLVFPWAEHGNLKHFVASQNWEILERISLIGDVAMGLAYLHSRNPPICHGDLKSLNILVLGRKEYRAAITDFGSARHVARGDPNAQTEQVGSQARSSQPLNATFCSSTNTVTLTGNNYSLRWAAPELLEYDQISLWSDIWALGWVAYEVVTDSVPFQDVKSDSLVVIRVSRGELPSLSDNAELGRLIQELCSLMTMCWEINPTARPSADSCRNSIKQMPKLAPNREGVQRVVPFGLLNELGRWHQSRGDSATAVDHLTDAIKRSRELRDEKQLVNALKDLARLHRRREEYDEALSLQSEVWEIYGKSLDNYHGEIVDGTRDLAKLRQLRGKRRIPVERARQSEEEECKLAQALYKIAQHYMLGDEYEKAVPLYSEALEIRTDLGSIKGRAEALWARAEVYRAQSQYDEAIPLYSEACEIRTDLGDGEGRADALWGLADVHRRRIEYDKAITLYSEVLKIPTDTWSGRKRADALWGLAGVYRLREEYNNAIPLYSEVLKIPTDTWGGGKRADALWGLAEVYRVREEYDQAIPLYSELLKIPNYYWDDKKRHLY